MAGYFGTKHRSQALKQFQKYQRLLGLELNGVPGPGIVELYEKIKTGTTGSVVGRDPVDDMPGDPAFETGYAVALQACGDAEPVPIEAAVGESSSMFLEYFDEEQSGFVGDEPTQKIHLKFD